MSDMDAERVRAVTDKVQRDMPALAVVTSIGIGLAVVAGVALIWSMFASVLGLPWRVTVAIGFTSLTVAVMAVGIAWWVGYKHAMKLIREGEAEG